MKLQMGVWALHNQQWQFVSLQQAVDPNWTENLQHNKLDGVRNL